MERAYFIVVFGLVLLISMASVSAITGKIGNGRMILDAEVGEKIERSILVINDNDVPLNITVFPTGDLEDEMNIVDKSFILEAGEEKKAYFTVVPKKSGTFNTKINVQFAPLGENENGVGLSSTVILKVVGEGEIIDDNNENNNEVNNTNEEGVSVSISGNSAAIVGGESEFKWEYLLGISTLLLAAVLIFLMYYSSKMGKKKSVKKGGVIKQQNGGKK